MSTSTLSLGIALTAPPAEVFHALTDSGEHSRFTRGTSVIDAREGGDFSYFGGAVAGSFREVSTTRIVQSLRAADWPEGVVATVEQQLEPRADGQCTFVRVREDGIPEDRAEAVIAGWSDYWDKLSDYLRERRLDVVRRFVDEYKNHQNWNIVDEFIAEDCKMHTPLPGLPQGREGVRLNGRMMCTAFPDVHAAREFFVTQGDIVVERAIVTATHKAALMGISASGKPVTWTELHAYRVSGNQITEIWSGADLMSVMVQIGAVQMPG